jgi:glycerol kinase
VAALIGAIDQGTTSTRFAVFDDRGRLVTLRQKEHRQILPRPGWVEHDPVEVWERVQEVTAAALADAGLRAADLAAVGVTNQRETVVAWDRATGRPFGHAVVWQDTRTDTICADLAADGGRDRFRAKTGLPLATYFSGPKMRWVLDHAEGARGAAHAGRLAFGTIDTWLVWNLTGGARGGRFVTDVTNASRTMLMDLASLSWDEAVADAIGVPLEALPEIRPSCEPFGTAAGILAGVPIGGVLGDQQGALVGQACFEPGEAKNTYGTGCFLLRNTGTRAVPSRHGLLTTVAYQVGGEPAVYALEGSVAIAGALVQWLRDNLGLISSSAEVEALARTTPDNGGVYIVPAFSGLFAPHWDASARGVVTGLTRFATRAHFARAALEATAYQTREVLDAMERDAGDALASLKVDGGMVGNDTLMQFQADLLGVPVIRPTVTETTALGAAYAAGVTAGVWRRLEDVRAHWRADRSWSPAMDGATRAGLLRQWDKAVARARGWIDS